MPKGTTPSLQFRQLGRQHIDSLVIYLNHLSPETRKRFDPHPFTFEKVMELFLNEDYLLFVAIEQQNSSIVAYFIVKKGWVEFDILRLTSYGLIPNQSDFTIAPSVADDWQNKGIGKQFLNYVITELKMNYNMNRLILWGGVQSDNIRAVSLYSKSSFRTLGGFEHNGNNHDMILDTRHEKLEL